MNKKSTCFASKQWIGIILPTRINKMFCRAWSPVYSGAHLGLLTITLRTMYILKSKFLKKSGIFITNNMLPFIYGEEIHLSSFPIGVCGFRPFSWSLVQALGANYTHLQETWLKLAGYSLEPWNRADVISFTSGK